MTDTVIFDLDGTLIDTEKYFKVFWIQAAAQFGYAMSEEQALTLRSMGKPFAPAKFKEWFGVDCDYDKIRDYRRLLMKTHLDKVGIELKPGVCETLEWLKKNNYFVALCTATPLDRATDQLKDTGIYSYFNEIVSAVQVDRGKPAPDVYLFACEKLGKQPHTCFAVEDSPNGVKSAAAAGLQVIMVPDQTKPEMELRKLLYACIPTLKDLPQILWVQKDSKVHNNSNTKG